MSKVIRVNKITIASYNALIKAGYIVSFASVAKETVMKRFIIRLLGLHGIRHRIAEQLVLTRLKEIGV